MTLSLPNRAVAAGLTLAVALWLGGAAFLAPAAQAVTIEELQATIADLQAQLAALTGGSSSAGCYAFTRDLTLGASGADVTALQDYLTGTGHFTFSGGSTGYFGTITQAAVAAWQAANGVAPAVGYFGPISRAKYNSMCTVAPADETTSSDLEGGSGSADYKLVAGFASEKVGENSSNVDVAGLEIEANGSDLEAKAIRLVFVHSSSGTSSSDDFDQVASEVCVSLAGEELACVPASTFNDTNTYSSTLTLDPGGIIREDDKGELVVDVSAGNLDSNDVGETWTVDFRSFRYVDAQGASISEDPGTATRTFSFETAATASNSELKIKEASNDLVNKPHMINLHATEQTDGVVLLDFTLQNVGSSDFTYREFGANIVTVGQDVSDAISGGTTPQAYLWLDGEAYGTASYQDDTDGVSVGVAEDILWDDVDFTHSAGTTVPGQIKVNMPGLDESPDLLDTIYATLGETETDQTALFDVRDETGTQIADVDITGSATGEASAFVDVGFDLALVGTPTAVKTTGNASTGTSDSGLFTITFDVTAWDGDIFIDNTAPVRVGATESDVNMSASTGTLTTSIRTDTGASAGTEAWTVEQDTTERFSIIGDVRDGATDDLADGFLSMALGNIRYALTAVTGTLTYTYNLGAFITPEIYLDDQGQ